HESASPPAESNQPTIESKIGDPYMMAGVPAAAAPAQPSPARTQELAMVARAPGAAMGTAVDAIKEVFRHERKEASLEAPEPDPNRQRPEKVVVEAWVTLVTDEVQPVAQQIRGRVAQLGGRVTEDRVGGAASQSWEGQLKVRLPPAAVPGF